MQRVISGATCTPRFEQTIPLRNASVRGQSLDPPQHVLWRGGDQKRVPCVAAGLRELQGKRMQEFELCNSGLHIDGLYTSQYCFFC